MNYPNLIRKIIPIVNNIVVPSLKEGEIFQKNDRSKNLSGLRKQASCAQSNSICEILILLSGFYLKNLNIFKIKLLTASMREENFKSFVQVGSK